MKKSYGFNIHYLGQRSRVLISFCLDLTEDCITVHIQQVVYTVFDSFRRRPNNC